MLALSGAALAAPPSYPLVCRGGAATLGYSGQQQAALFYFTKSPQRSGLGLAAGNCAWVDRAVGPNEPTCLKQSGVHANAWIFPNNLTASYFTSDQAQWLRNLLNANNYQVFQAYNPGDGNCFVVTRLGY